MLGQPAFGIDEMCFAPEEGIITGVVRFSFEDHSVPGGVWHHVRATVRVTESEIDTLEQAREALFQAAVEQLRLALRVAEGNTAQQLISASVTDFRL